MNNKRDDVRPISSLLSELLETRGMTEQKLAYATDVPLRFIQAIRNGDLSKLPARPYVHGYLKKIAVVFDIDEKTLWQAYLTSTTEQTPKEDRLPSNRFAHVRANRKKIIAFAVVAALIAFLGYRFNYIIGKPELTLSLESEGTIVTSERILIVRGTATPGDELALNGEIIYTDEAGSFEKEVALNPGLNTLQFSARRFLGREMTVTRQVVYNEPAVETPATEETAEEGTEGLGEENNETNVEIEGQQEEGETGL